MPKNRDATPEPQFADIRDAYRVEIGEKTDSTEFSVNAKGELAYKVKCYDTDIDVALERARLALISARNVAMEWANEKPAD
jgi:hypothetical protein